MELIYNLQKFELILAKGLSSETPVDYDEWYDNCIIENNLNEPFEWF